MGRSHLQRGLVLVALGTACACTSILGDFDTGGDDRGGGDAGVDASDASMPTDGEPGTDAAPADAGPDGCVVKPSAVFLNDAIAIAGGGAHACAIRADHSLVCWGDNGFGQLGVPQPVALSSTAPLRVQFPPDAGDVRIQSIALSETTTFAIDSKLQLWAWGNNQSGLLANGTVDKSPTPHPVPQLVQVGGTPLLAQQIAAGWYHACALDSTSYVRCWGANFSKQLGDQLADASPDPTPVSAFFGPFSGPSPRLGSGNGAIDTCIASGEPSMRCWGEKGGYALLVDNAGTFGGSINYNAEKPLLALDAGFPLLDVQYGTNFGCVLDARNTPICWGSNSTNQLGPDGGIQAPFRLPVADAGVKSMGLGYVHACFTDATEHVRCLGSNQFGQLGRGAVDAGASSGTPGTVVGADGGVALEGALEARSGFWFTCARTEGECGGPGPGPVVCWGANDKGQLGSDAGARSSTPVYVSAPR